MTITAKATRNNFRDFGAPTTGYWFGRGKNPSGGELVTFERHGRGITVRDGAGNPVDSFGDTGKFWFAPVDAAAPAGETPLQAEIDAAHVEAAYEHFMARQIRDYRGSATAAAAARVARGPMSVRLHLSALHATLAHAASEARVAGRRLLAAAIEARAEVVAVELAAAKYAEAVDDATRTTVALPPAPVVEPAAELEPAPAAAPAPVVIVPCGGKKAAGTLPAGEKYIGSYHLMTRKAAAAVAERTGARVLILSARYGLLELDDLVDDYDLQMGDPGSVTAGRVAEQAAALGIVDALVTVVAGKRYADVVTAVWPHAVRVLDGTNGMPHQMKRMAEVVRGEWKSAAATAAAAAPALFGAELVAPPAVTVAQAADLVRGDVLAPGTFGEQQHADPLVVTGTAVPVDQPGGRRRVALYAHRSTGGRARHLIVWADHTVDVVDRMPGMDNGAVLPPAEEAEILDGPAALTWPRLITGDRLQAGDLVAPGGFGPWNKTDTITVVTGPKYSDTVMGVRRYDIGTQVNLPKGPGPVVHGAIRADSYVPVLERRPALEAVMVAPARGSMQSGALEADVLEDNPGESTVHVAYRISGARAWIARGRIVGPAPAAVEAAGVTPAVESGDAAQKERACRAISFGAASHDGGASAGPDTPGNETEDDMQLTDTMKAAIIGTTGDALACGRGTAAALIRRGLAEPVRGNAERKNRYSYHAQTVYDVYLGARLTDAGKALRAELRAAAAPVAELEPAPVAAPARPAVTGTAYINLPIGTSLPEHGALPMDTVVVLARGEFWNSQYRTTPNLTMHIVAWGLPTVSLCRVNLVATEGREEYVGVRDGKTYTKSSGRPALAGRDDARFGYVDDSDCDGCKRAFARMTRETLPSDMRYRMIDARRAERERKAAEKTAALEGAPTDPTAVEPIDLADVVETATVDTMPSTDLVPAAAAPVPAPRSCGTDGAALDLNILRAGDVEPGALVDAVNLHDYDVVLINISAGKDSMALLIALVALAHAQGYDLARLVAVHCDLGRVEWAGTAELAEEHARTMGVQFYRVANSVDLLDQVRQRFRNLQRKAGELRAEAADLWAAGGSGADVEALNAQADKKANAPAWFSSKARYCTKSQKTGEVEKLMTALAKLWREAGNTDRPIRILNTLGIRADESAARALKTPLGPDSATNTRREVTRWLPIFTWSEAQVWDAIRRSGLRVHGAYLLGMTRLSCALCVLGSKSDMLIGARANRDLVDEYAAVEDEVGSTFLAGTSVREIGARADELGPLELPAPRALDDVLADQDAPADDVDQVAEDLEPAGDVDGLVTFEAAQVVTAHAAELLATFGATPDLFGDLVAPPRHALALTAAPARPAAAAAPAPAPRPELHTDALFALPPPRRQRRPSRARRPTLQT